MKSGIGFEINLNSAYIDKVSKEAVLGCRDAMKLLYEDMKEAQVMPYKTGHMQDEATKVQKRGKVVTLITDTPYAKRLYYHPEYNFNHEHNAHAKAFWTEDYVDGDKKDFLLKATAECIRKRLGRKQK